MKAFLSLFVYSFEKSFEPSGKKLFVLDHFWYKTMVIKVSFWRKKIEIENQRVSGTVFYTST